MPIYEPDLSRVVSPSNELEQGFTKDIPANELLKDRRVLQQMRDYYNETGESFSNDEEMISEYMSDMRWRSANTVGAAMDLNTTENLTPKGKEAYANLLDVFQRVPSFSDEGGGVLGWLTTYGAAGILDPINLVGGAVGKSVGIAGTKAATIAGQSALREGIKAGVKHGAIQEAAANAAASGVISGLEQERDIGLGRRDEFSKMELLGDTALGGAIGGVLGGGIGGAVGAVQAPKRILAEQARQMGELGLPDAASAPGLGESIGIGARGLGREAWDTVARPFGKAPSELSPEGSAGRFDELARGQADQISVARQAETDRLAAEAAAAIPEVETPPVTRNFAAELAAERKHLEDLRKSKVDKDTLAFQQSRVDDIGARMQIQHEIDSVTKAKASMEDGGKADPATLSTFTSRLETLQDAATRIDNDPTTNGLEELRKLRGIQAAQAKQEVNVDPQAKKEGNADANGEQKSADQKSPEDTQVAGDQSTQPKTIPEGTTIPGVTSAQAQPETQGVVQPPPPPPADRTAELPDLARQFYDVFAADNPGFADYFSGKVAAGLDPKTVEPKTLFQIHAELVKGPATPKPDPVIKAQAAERAKTERLATAPPPVADPRVLDEIEKGRYIGNASGEKTKAKLQENAHLLTAEDVQATRNAKGLTVGELVDKKVTERRRQQVVNAKEAEKQEKVRAQQIEAELRAQQASAGEKAAAAEKTVKVAEQAFTPMTPEEASAKAMDFLNTTMFADLLKGIESTDLGREALAAAVAVYRNIGRTSAGVMDRMLSKIGADVADLYRGKLDKIENLVADTMRDVYVGAGDDPRVAELKALVYTFGLKAKEAAPPKGATPKEAFPYLGGSFGSEMEAQAHATIQANKQVIVGYRTATVPDRNVVTGAITMRRMKVPIYQKQGFSDPVPWVFSGAAEEIDQVGRVDLRSGKQRKAPKRAVPFTSGQRVWYDPITRRSYGTMEELLQVRDGKGFTSAPVAREDLTPDRQPSEAEQARAQAVIEQKAQAAQERVDAAQDAVTQAADFRDRTPPDSENLPMAEEALAGAELDLQAAQKTLDRLLGKAAPTPIDRKEFIRLARTSGVDTATDRLHAQMLERELKPAPEAPKRGIDREVRARKVAEMPTEVPTGRRGALFPKDGNIHGVRILRDKQVAEGKTVRDLLGEEGNPEDFIVGHVPETLAADKKNAAAYFEPFESKATTEAPKPKGMSRDSATMMLLRDSDIAELRSAGWAVDPSRTVEWLNHVLAFEDAEKSWGLIPNKDTFGEHVDKLRAGYRVLSELAPGGILRDVATREEAIAEVRRMFAKQPPAILAEAERFLARLAGDASPILSRDPLSPPREGKVVLGQFRKDLDTAEANRVYVNTETDVAHPVMGTTAALQTLWHEVAHWAYINILTPEDRLTFWEGVGEQMYDKKTGQISEAAFDRLLGPRHNEKATGGNLTGNGRSVVNELFAEQFVTWMGRESETVGDPAFWGRMTQILKAVFDWFHGKNPVAPEFEALFSKIVPNEEERMRLAAGGGMRLADLSDIGRHVRSRGLQLDDLENDFFPAWLDSDPAAMVYQSKEVLRHIASLVPSFHGKEKAKGSFGPLAGMRNELIEARKALLVAFRDSGIEVNEEKLSVAASLDRSDPFLTELTELFATGKADADTLDALFEIRAIPKQMERRIRQAMSDPQARAKVLDDVAAYVEESPVVGDAAADAAFVHEQLGEDGVMRIADPRYADKALRDLFETMSLPDLFGTMRALYRQALIDTDGIGTLNMAEIPESIRQAKTLTPEMLKKHREQFRSPPAAMRRYESRLLSLGIEPPPRRVGEPGAKAVGQERTDATKARKAQAAAAISRRKLTKLDQDGLLDLWRKTDSDADKRQIASVLTEKLNAEIPASEAEIYGRQSGRRPYTGLRSPELHAKAIELLDSGDADGARQVAMEMRLRQMKKSGDSAGLSMLTFRETAMRDGIEDSVSVPAKAPLLMKPLLKAMQHRDPAIARTQRTLAFRLLSLAGDHQLLTNAHVAELLGWDPPETVSPISVSDDAYKELRKSARHLAVATQRGAADPEETVGQLAKLLVRSGALSDRRADVQSLFDRWVDSEAGRGAALDTYDGILTDTPESWLASLWTKTASNTPSPQPDWVLDMPVAPEVFSRLTSVGAFDSTAYITPRVLAEKAMSLELAAWKALGDKAGFDRVMAERAAVYDALETALPTGVKMPTVSAKQTLAQAKAIFSKHDPEVLDAAISLLSGTGFRGGEGFRLREADLSGEGARGITTLGFRGTESNAVVLSNRYGSMATGEKNPQSGADRLSTLIHEVGHWAYFNILGRDERDAFWKWVETANFKRGPDGGFVREAPLLHTNPSADPSFGGVRSNAAESPQEMFAELFNAWAQSRGDSPVAQPSWWDTFSADVRDVLEWHTNPMSVPDELTQVMSRILPVGDSGIALPVGTAAKLHGLSVNAAFPRELFGADLAAKGRAVLQDMTDAAAYVLNGQVADGALKDRYLRLFLYGDLFDNTDKALSLDARVRPGREADYEAKLLTAMSQTERESLRQWTRGGAGEYPDGSPKVHYLTPDGEIVRRTPGAKRTPGQLTSPRAVALAERRNDLLDAADQSDFRAENLRNVFRTNGGDTHLTMAREAEARARRLEDQANAIEDRLTEMGEPLFSPVEAVSIRADDPLDLSDSAWMDVQSSQFEDVVSSVAARAAQRYGGVDIEDALRIYASAESVGGTTVRGDVFYQSLLDAVAHSVETDQGTAKALVDASMFDLGHDVVLHAGGQVVLRDPSVQARSIKGLLENPEPKESLTPSPVAGRTVGSVIQAMALSDDAATPKHALRTAFGSLPPADREIGDLFSEISEGGVPSEAGLTKLREASRSTRTFGTNAKRMHQYGMRYLGKYTEDYSPAVNQQFGQWWAPLVDALRAVEPESSALGRAARNYGKNLLAPFSKAEQPEAHAKVMRVLRYAPGTTHFDRLWAGLKPKERDLYKTVRQTFGSALDRLKQAGVVIGTVKNYVPQVWDTNVIAKSPEAYRHVIAGYLKREWAREGRTVDNPDLKAQEIADGMLAKLTQEDGVYIPEHRGTGGAGRADSLDYQRMIRLQDDPIAMAEIDEFARNGTPLLLDNLETITVRYLDQAARRAVEADTLGHRAFALNDYTRAVFEGRGAVADLLSSNKVWRMRRYIGSDGGMEMREDNLPVAMPFATAKEATAFVDTLTAAIGENNPAAGVAMIMARMPEANRQPYQKAAYARRAEAIANGIADAGGYAKDTGVPLKPIHAQGYKDAMGTVLALQGRLNSGANEHMKAFSRGMRTFNSISLLSMATLSSLGDVLLPLVRSGDFRAWTKGMAKFASDPDYRRQIRNTGVAWESVLHNRMTGLYAGDVGGTAGKIQTAFFNFNMLTQWTDLARQLAGATGLESLRTQVDIAARAYKPKFPPMAQPPEWKRANRILKAYGLESWATKPAGLLDPSDPAVARAMIKFADDTVFSPGAAETPLWAQTPAGSMAWQLKSFPMAMQRMALGSDGRGGVLRNAFRAGRQWLSQSNPAFKDLARPGDDAYTAKDAVPAMMLLSAAPAFGALVVGAKDLAQARGKDENDKSARQLKVRNLATTPVGEFMGMEASDQHDVYGWMWDSMLMVGGLGYLAELLQSTAANADNGYFGLNRTMSTLLGPSYAITTDAYAVLQGGLRGTRRAAGFIPEEELGTVGLERGAINTVLKRVPVLGSQNDARMGIVDSIVPKEDEGATKSPKGWGEAGWGKKGWGN
jgi:hypothetical protein